MHVTKKLYGLNKFNNKQITFVLILAMETQQFEFRESESLIPVRSRTSNSHSSRRRRLSSSMTVDITRLPEPPVLGLGMWAGLGEDLYLPLGGISGSERVRTITNDLADACALLESQSQRAILEDCLWNVEFSQQPLRSNPLVDSSPLIGFDSPLKPLPSRGT